MKRIIVCDDDMESIIYLQNLLDEYFFDRNVRCEVVYYKSGKELILAENSDIDVAILDVEMDKLNGIQTGYEILRRCPKAVLMKRDRSCFLSFFDCPFFQKTSLFFPDILKFIYKRYIIVKKYFVIMHPQYHFMRI